MLDLQHRQALFKDQQLIELLHGVGDNPQRPRLKRLLNVAIAVGRTALHRHKNQARSHSPRVVLDAGHRRLAEPAARSYRRHFRN